MRAMAARACRNSRETSICMEARSGMAAVWKEVVPFQVQDRGNRGAQMIARDAPRRVRCSLTGLIQGLSIRADGCEPRAHHW
jgi:hypothetical protein